MGYPWGPKKASENNSRESFFLMFFPRLGKWTFLKEAAASLAAWPGQAWRQELGRISYTNYCLTLRFWTALDIDFILYFHRKSLKSYFFYGPGFLNLKKKSLFWDSYELGGVPLGKEKSVRKQFQGVIFPNVFSRAWKMEFSKGSSRQPGGLAWTGLAPRVRQDFLYKLLPNSLVLGSPGD